MNCASRNLVLAIASFIFFFCSGVLSEAAEKTPILGAKAPDFELKSLAGEPVKLSTEIKRGPVVLVVLRGYPGYQCPVCTAQFGDYVAKKEQFKAAGAQVLFVYPGPADRLVERAKEFVRGKDYPAHFQILLDPDFSFINAYGLRWDARNETAYPSTFIVDPNQKVTFAKVSQGHGDRSKAADMLKVITGK
jgi:peroxiredoxin